MNRLLIVETEIRASAVRRGGDGFISAVTVVHGRNGTPSGMASHHEWDDPVFESEAEALQFAWRRAPLMAQSLTE